MSSNFSPLYFEQPIVVLDTTQALNASSGSFVLYGGVSINAAYESNDTSSGAFVLSGGMAVQKQLNVGGITHIVNSTESEGTASGALVVSGGVGIGGNLHVGQDTFISGNLYVNGVTTSVSSTTVNISDNTFTLNSGPSGSRDSGVLIQRYQTSSETGAGDIVAAHEPVVVSGLLTSGGTNSVQFATSDPTLDVTGWWIMVNGLYTRQISSSTNVAGTITLNFNDADQVLSSGILVPTHNDAPFLTAVDVGDSFGLYNRNYVAQYYDEANDELILGYVANAGDIQITLKHTDLLNVRSKGLYAENSTIGNLYAITFTAGNISMNDAVIKNTFQVTGTTTLASLMVSNGSQVGGNLTVSGGSVLNGGITTGSLFVTGASLLQGSFGVTGASYLGSDVYVTGGTYLNSSLQVMGESALVSNVYVTGGTYLNSNLEVMGDSALVSNVYVTGGTYSGSLNVTGVSFLLGAATAGSVNVIGDSILQGMVTAGALAVTGESLLRGAVTAGALNVTGNSILQGMVTAGALNVTGESFLQGAATAGSFNVIGDSILQGMVTAGALAVTGESLLRGAVTAGALNVTGNSILQGMVTAGALNVTGESFLQGAATAGSFNVIGNSILQGMVTTGALFVTGESTLLSSVTMGSNLVVAGPALQIPIGDLASRPATPLDGYVRYNTETQQFEGYGPGSAWGSLGGVIDIAQTTKILASATPSTTDGNLYFITVGSERMRVNSSGNIGINTTAPGYLLDVNGTLNAAIGLTAGSLNVTGNSLLHGFATAGALNVTGDSILQGMVTAGALAVTGESLLRGAVTAGALNVTGNSILQGMVTAGALSVTGATLLRGGLTTGSICVTGATLLQNNLYVTGGSVAIDTPITGIYNTNSPTTGGSLIVNTVDIIPSLGDISREREFIMSGNPISSAEDITGFVFNNDIVRAFDAVVSVSIFTIGGSNDRFAYYNLKGVQKGANWVLNSSYVGDVTGLTFSIGNNGQIKYTSTSVSGFDQGFINFRALTTTKNVVLA